MLHLDYDIIYKVSATGMLSSIKFLRNHVADRLCDILTTKCNNNSSSSIRSFTLIQYMESKRSNHSFGMIIRYCSNFIIIYRIRPVPFLKIFSLVPDDFFIFII